MAEEEPMMSNFEMQETAIYFRVASSLFEELFAEAASEISAIAHLNSI
jgi:hypothetical protein